LDGGERGGVRRRHALAAGVRRQPGTVLAGVTVHRLLVSFDPRS
jgi:hypothetical protein